MKYQIKPSNLNKIRELNEIEIKEANGGIWGALVALAAAALATAGCATMPKKKHDH